MHSPGPRLYLAVTGKAITKRGVARLLAPFGIEPGSVRFGSPVLDGAKVTAKVVRQFRGPKINGFTYKAKKHQARRYGHRQSLTELLIESIQG